MSSAPIRRAVVVMGKLPKAGRVKTRLSPELPSETAASLYRAFLLDTFALVDRAHALSGCSFDRLFACALDQEDEVRVAEALLPDGWRFTAQRGEDLGQRIESARRDAGGDDAVIVGSDSPTLPPERILEAFEELDRAHRACAPRTASVVGPTADGGYYLIALRGEAPELFCHVPWSTPRVLNATRSNAWRAGIELVELPLGYDVDEMGDLPRALRDASAPGSTAEHTKIAVTRALALWARDA